MTLGPDSQSQNARRVISCPTRLGEGAPRARIASAPRTPQVLEALQALPDPRAKLGALCRSADARASRGGAHAALLAAASDPRIELLLQRATRARLGALEALFGETSSIPEKRGAGPGLRFPSILASPHCADRNRTISPTNTKSTSASNSSSTPWYHPLGRQNAAAMTPRESLDSRFPCEPVNREPRHVGALVNGRGFPRLGSSSGAERSSVGLIRFDIGAIHRAHPRRHWPSDEAPISCC